MMNFGYNNRWVRLVKDLLFVGLGVWLITTSRILAVVVGVLALYWYGRDAWFQAKALWQEKHFRPNDTVSKPAAGPADDKKITVTDLRNAKEVDFEKE